MDSQNGECLIKVKFSAKWSLFSDPVSSSKWCDKFCTPSESPISSDEDLFEALPSDATGSTKGEFDESVLASATRKLKLEFSTLFTSVRLSLEKRQVSAKSLLSHLKTLEAIDPEFGITKPMASDKNQLKTIDSLEELFPAIAPYCSWFNHLLLKNIIKTFCEDDTRLLQRLKKFKERLAKYCKSRLCKCPPDQFGEDHPHGNTTPVVMKIDSKWKAVKVVQLEVIRNTVAQILNIKPYNLYLRSVKNGCIELTFHIPNFVASKCLPPSSEQITALQIAGIAYIQYSHLWTLAIGSFASIEGFKEGAMRRVAEVKVRKNIPGSAEKDIEMQQQLEHEQVMRTRAEKQIQKKTGELQQQTFEMNSIQQSLQKLCAELEDREARLRAQEEEMQQRDTEINRLLGELRRCQTRLLRQQTPLAELKSCLKLKWRRGEDMPYGMYGPQAVVIGDNVYVGGGESYNAETVLVYSVQTESWRTLPPHETELFGMASVNNQLVLVGGVSVSSDEATNVLVVWDERPQVWTHPFPVMPTARYAPSVISYQKWLVVAGGVDDRGSLSNKVELLDTLSLQWYKGSPLPTACEDMSSAINGNMWYLSGGISSSGRANKRVFDVCLDELISQAVSQSASSTPSPWQTLPEAPLEYSTVLICNRALLTVGGEDSSSIHLYQPGSRSWVKAGELPYHNTQYRCACTVLPNGQMFVASGHGVYIAPL